MMDSIVPLQFSPEFEHILYGAQILVGIAVRLQEHGWNGLPESARLDFHAFGPPSFTPELLTLFSTISVQDPCCRSTQGESTFLLHPSQTTHHASQGMVSFRHTVGVACSSPGSAPAIGEMAYASSGIIGGVGKIQRRQQRELATPALRRPQKFSQLQSTVCAVRRQQSMSSVLVPRRHCVWKEFWPNQNVAPVSHQSERGWTPPQNSSKGVRNVF